MSRIVCLISSLQRGGAERVMSILANNWAEHDHKVVVVTLSGTANDAYPLRESVSRIGLDLLRPSPTPWRAIKNNWARIRAVRRVLKRLQPDVAIAFMDRTNVFLALAGWGLPIRRIIGAERTHPPALSIGGRIWTLARAFMYRRLHVIVALTQTTATWLRLNTYSRHVVVIPNPAILPLPITEPITEPNVVVSTRDRLVLAVGRLDSGKGFDYLIDAFARVSPRYPDWRLVILGEGPKRAELEARVAACGLQSRVTLPGAVGNVRDWYLRSDLVALSSRFEGYPNVLIEALAHGVPVVAFDCDTGPRDIVRHEIDGILVRPGDVPGFAAAMDRLMGDPELRTAFADRAGEIRQRLSMRRITVAWERLF